MATENFSVDGRRLHIAFIPLMSPGHMIPMLDIANLFALRGVSATVITTPGNEPLARPAIDRSPAANPIILRLLPFPSSAAQFLHEGGENLSLIPSYAYASFMAAVAAFQTPLDRLLRDIRPDAIVSDSILISTTATAADLNVPRLVFHGHGLYPQCVHERLESDAPHRCVADDSEPFVVEGLPHRVELRRCEVSPIFNHPEFLRELREVEERSFGVVINTFYSLEPGYADLYRSKPSRKAWFLGPVSSLHDCETHTVLNWLDLRPQGSVIYICFGSLCEFTVGQLREMGRGLVASGHPFVWVVRDGAVVGEEEWAPAEGGMVVRGWVPQRAVLGHRAVGGFVTHCGWNSTMDAVGAGVPVVTWPLLFEQFVNEKFIVEVLGIGVKVRSTAGPAEVAADDVAAAVVEVMSAGEAAEGRRRRARELAAAARAAVEEGGSSHEDVTCLIAELSATRDARESQCL